MCLRKTDISLKTKEHSGSGHAKASPSGSVHKTPFTSGSFYFILLCEFALFPISGVRFRTSGKRRKSSLSLRYSLGPCVPPKTGHALHAPLSLCVMETPCASVPLLYNICTATFCAVLSQSLLLVFDALLVVGWLCSECAEKINMRGEDRSQVSLKFTHEHVSHSSNSFRASTPSRNPLTPQAWVLIHPRSPKHRC